MCNRMGPNLVFPGDWFIVFGTSIGSLLSEGASWDRLVQSGRVST